MGFGNAYGRTEDWYWTLLENDSGSAEESANPAKRPRNVGSFWSFVKHSRQASHGPWRCPAIHMPVTLRNQTSD